MKLDISYSSKSITFETVSSFEYEIFGDHFTPFTATVRSTVFYRYHMFSTYYFKTISHRIFKTTIITF
ncbi:hypothetical protein BVL87_10305 [Staphylococcus epidermidis]|nr:hypothetical protein BVL87_10305 [Staphylococcus epidermidis]